MSSVLSVELKERTEGLQMTLDEVLDGTSAVQAEFDATRQVGRPAYQFCAAFRACFDDVLLYSRDLEDLEACEQDADHAHARIEELVRAGDESEPSHRHQEKIPLIR